MKKFVNFLMIVVCGFMLASCDKSNNRILPIDENSKYLIYDREVSNIIYTIEFAYEEVETTLELHEQFVLESGLGDLEYSSLFYFPNSKYIYIYFKPAQNTSEVNIFISSLKNRYDVILSIEREVEYVYSSVYMHNPVYYGLDEKDSIGSTLYSLTLCPSVLSSGVYDSVDKINNELETYFEDSLTPSYMLERKEEIINDINNFYNEEYFRNRVLIITETITTGSTSNKQELNSIYLKNNQLYIFVKMYFATYGDGAMQDTRFALTIDQNKLGDVDDLKINFLYKKNNNEWNY